MTNLTVLIKASGAKNKDFLFVTCTFFISDLVIVLEGIVQQRVDVFQEILLTSMSGRIPLPVPCEDRRATFAIPLIIFSFLKQHGAAWCIIY